MSKKINPGKAQPISEDKAAAFERRRGAEKNEILEQVALEKLEEAEGSVDKPEDLFEALRGTEKNEMLKQVALEKLEEAEGSVDKPEDLFEALRGTEKNEMLKQVALEKLEEAEGSVDKPEDLFEARREAEKNEILEQVALEKQEEKAQSIKASKAPESPLMNASMYNTGPKRRLTEKQTNKKEEEQTGSTSLSPGGSRDKG